MWGTMLAHVGHGACPKWAQPVSKMCPKRFKDETPEKGMINDQSPDDTLMILFCKESRKVSLSQLVGTMDFIYMEKPENDTMTLLYRKNESMPRT